MSTYTIQPGETLETIAEKLFGDKALAQYLASINNIPGVPGVAGGWFYPTSSGQTINTDVPGVTAKKWPTGLIVAGLATAAAAIYYRKSIVSFFKSLI